MGDYPAPVRTRGRGPYAVALLLLLIGCGVVLFALPTKYGCNSGGAAFTTSKSAAYDSCVGDLTGGVAVDRRIPARATTIMLVVFVEALLLRLASAPVADDDPLLSRTGADPFPGRGN
jgi:hypothetical protein